MMGGKGEYDINGNVQYSNNMVNYPGLTELYACLIDPEYIEGRKISLVVSENEMSIRSIALSPGDTISIQIYLKIP